MQKYTKDLEHFVKIFPPRVQFVEDIDEAVLRNFQDITLKEDYSAKTLHNRFVTVAQMLADAGSTIRPNRKNAPKPVQDTPRAYSDDELRKLFSVFDAEERSSSNFSLAPGAVSRKCSTQSGQT